MLFLCGANFPFHFVIALRQVIPLLCCFINIWKDFDGYCLLLLSDVDEFLLFSASSRIGTISLDTQSGVDVTTPIHPDPKKVLSLDYDLKNDHIYWIEEDSPYIYRAPAKGGNKEIVLKHGLVRPTALAIDWLGGNLYFADSGTRRLEVCRLDGSSRKVLASDNNVGEVLSIVLDLNSQ